jgi:hypothetical protein
MPTARRHGDHGHAAERHCPFGLRHVAAKAPAQPDDKWDGQNGSYLVNNAAPKSSPSRLYACHEFVPERHQREINRSRNKHSIKVSLVGYATCKAALAEMQLDRCRRVEGSSPGKSSRRVGRRREVSAQYQIASSRCEAGRLLGIGGS